MSLTFGKTKVANFGRILHGNPRTLTRHPYLNYLRHFKIIHPTYGFKRMLNSGATAWKKLTPGERNRYSQKEVLKSLQRQKRMAEKFKAFARRPIPFNFKRRSLHLSENIKRNWPRKQRHKYSKK